MTTRTILAAALAFGFAAAPLAAEDVKIAMNGVNDPVTNAEAAFAKGFADALTGTDFDVKVFASDTLGSEKERFDQVSQGLVEIDLATVSTAFGMSPLMKGVLLPFMFRDNEEFDTVIEQTDILKASNEPLTVNGIRLAGYNYIGTGLGIHNSKHPITKMSDLADLRFRALNAEQLAYQEALGAQGTIVAWSEVANALQTGVADGYFNAPNSAIRTGHTAFLVHYTPVNISPSTRAVFISEDWYQALEDAEKAQIDAALEAGFTANRDWIDEWSKTVRQKHKDAGVTISELEAGEREKMVEAASTTWADIMTPEHLNLYTDALEQVRQ